MDRVVLKMPGGVQQSLWRHLLPRDTKAEAAAFVLARPESMGDELLLSTVDWWPLSGADLESCSAWYLELSDAAKAIAIKRAHDNCASLIEVHSHLGKWPAQFSDSDWAGFEEIVPHVWWRLKGKPYAAIVVAESGFDAIAWVSAPKEPQLLDAIETEYEVLRPTGLSLKHQRDWHEQRQIR